MTIATLQLGVGCLYGLFLWAAPDARKLPTTTKDDILACIPVAFCSAAAHSFSVFGACPSLSRAHAHTPSCVLVCLFCHKLSQRAYAVFTCAIIGGERTGFSALAWGTYEFV